MKTFDLFNTFGDCKRGVEKVGKPSSVFPKGSHGSGHILLCSIVEPLSSCTFLILCVYILLNMPVWNFDWDI